jgi:iron(III) transport system substrate-binding protein
VAKSAAGLFEKETGVQVRLVPEDGQAEVEGLSDRLTAGAGRLSADLLWAGDPLSATILKSKGLSAPYESRSTKNLQKGYSDPERHWTGFPGVAVVILYNKGFSQQSCHQGPFDLPSFRLERISLVSNGKA